MYPYTICNKSTKSNFAFGRESATRWASFSFSEFLVRLKVEPLVREGGSLITSEHSPRNEPLAHAVVMASALLDTWALSKEPQDMPLDRCDPETAGLRGLDLGHCQRLAKALVESPVLYQGDPWIVVQDSSNEDCMCMKYIVCTKLNFRQAALCQWATSLFYIEECREI